MLRFQRRKYAGKYPNRGPDWRWLAKFFNEYLKVDICPPAVREIRDLRHILTHNRGRCRTDDQRSRFGTMYEEDDFPSRRVELTREKAEDMCDSLAQAVRTIDPKVWQYSWGRARLDFS